MAPKRKIVILYDGTWCGPETETGTNIHLLATMIGIDPSANDPTYTSPLGDIRAKYFQGVGLGGSFMRYLWDGAFATNAERECTAVYDFIVQNFNSNSEVWMFGLSRGAYILRSVGGMINNCGIVTDRGNARLIHQIYNIYRNPHPVHEPSSEEMIKFRDTVSYPKETPVKFMGLFDTVGSRGVPKLNYHTGSGFEWPEFYDDKVSSAVEKVYHAVSTHDRLWAFQPCLAWRDAVKHKDSPTLRIYQKWFPGTHYDLARQEFQFLPEGGATGMIKPFLFRLINRFSRSIAPNHQLADLALLWILEGVKTQRGADLIQNDSSGTTKTLDDVISALQPHLPTQDIGTGDIYADITRYVPLGNFLFLPLAVTRGFYKELYDILFRPLDRVIPDLGIASTHLSTLVKNEVYDYTAPDSALGDIVIGSSAEVGTRERQDKRYPSETFQNYVAYMEATKRQV